MALQQSQEFGLGESNLIIPAPSSGPTGRKDSDARPETMQMSELIIDDLFKEMQESGLN